MFYYLTKEELIVCGGFNFHVNRPSEHKYICQCKPSAKVLKSKTLHSIYNAHFRADIQDVADESKSIEILDSIVKHYNQTDQSNFDKYTTEQKL